MPTSIETTVSTQTKNRPTVRLAAVDGNAEQVRYNPALLAEIQSISLTTLATASQLAGRTAHQGLDGCARSPT